MTQLGGMKIKIFADGADLAGIKAMYAKPWIKGFTTNPTLMRKAGVADYKAFALEVLKAVPDVTLDGPLMTSTLAAAGATVTYTLPVIAPVTMSVAVTNCRPARLSVTVKVCTPWSALVNV